MIAQAVDEEDVLAFGLLQQIAQLVLPIVGVHGQQDGADLGGGELQRHPVRHVGGPDGDLFPFPHAQRHQALGEVVHHFGKFPPGLAVVAVGIDHGVPVREARHGLVQDLAQRLFPQDELRLTFAYLFIHN